MANLWRYDAETEKWVKVSEDDPLPVVGELDVDINTSDIEIGAVELKDATGTSRATIDSDGALKVVEKTPLTGFATAANQRIVANTTEYTQADLVTNVLTIASSKGLYLKNDGTSDFTITIGSLTFTVKPGEVRCIETAAAFTTVTFSAGAIFRAFGVTRSA